MNNLRPRAFALLSAAVPVAAALALAGSAAINVASTASARPARVAVAPHDLCNAPAVGFHQFKFPDCAGD